MIRRLSPVLFFCAVLSGCGGGGGGATLPQTQPTAGAPTGAQSVVVSITVPAAAASGSALKRRPLYVSPNTQSAAISVNGGTPVIANLAPGSPNCSAGSPRTCSITVSAPVGNDTFSESTFANATGTGAALSISTTSATIIASKANVVTMTLDGVVASIALALATPNPPVGIATSIGLTVTFKDASGAAIIGNDPFANPITLTDSDTSGATKLSAATLHSPGDAAQLSVTYTGAPLAQATLSASATGVPASSVSPAVLAPVSTAFVDWPTYAYDAQRSGFNPYSTSFTPASLGQLHVGWQTSLGSAQSQPLVITNIAGHQGLLIVVNYDHVEAVDALTGSLTWSTALPRQSVQGCGSGGISGTPAYDKALGALFMAAGTGVTDPNDVQLYKIDVATGGIDGHVDLTPNLLPGEANYAHSGITFANGLIYAGTGSDCEGQAAPGLPSWRGRVVSIDPATMTVQNTFYPTWNQGGNFGGGGVWAWGGVSADSAGNVYVSTGNAETNSSNDPGNPAQPPFVRTDDEQAGYAEHLLKLTKDLSTVEGSDYPGFNFSIGYGDLDYTGTPVIYQPALRNGCGQLSATQGKGGTLVINNTNSISPASGSVALSVPSGTAYYIGNPAYSPNTGLLYAPITSSGPGSSLLPPGLAAIDGCGANIAWHAQFGPDSALYPGVNPRSAPTITAGGVVFIATPCTPDGSGSCGAPGAQIGGAVWAVDGASGTVLGGGKPLLITADVIRMAPSVDGLWMWVVDGSGNFYGLTIDQAVKAITPQAGHRFAPKFVVKHR